MRLLVVRHAKAEDTSSSGGDFERNLTLSGIARAEALGRIIKQKDLVPSEVYCSPLNRTVQTAQLLRKIAFPDTDIAYLEELGPDITLYESLRPFLESKATNDLTIMIIGHQPELGFLVSTLLSPEQKRVEAISPGTLVVLNLREWIRNAAELIEVI